jgi:hypothetical protein
MALDPMQDPAHSKWMPTVAPLDLTPYLAREIKNRIKFVGVEIEGGWTALPKGVRIHRDSSVFKKGDIELYYKPDYIPESGCGELNTGIVQPIVLGKWLEKFYPAYCDHTCGLHIHMSFETEFYYGTLMVPEYPATIRHYVQKWAEKEDLEPEHPLWGRLLGKSVYCQQRFWPDLQVRTNDKDYSKERVGHRYTDINYSGPHDTIECRLLPMMDTPARSLRALNVIMDVTNACLVALAKVPRAEVEVFEVPLDIFVEHTHERI